jgi:hypothetical protein
MDLIFGGLGTRFLVFVVRGQHRTLGDPITTALVWIFRGAFAVLVIGILFLIFGRA